MSKMSVETRKDVLRELNGILIKTKEINSIFRLEDLPNMSEEEGTALWYDLGSVIDLIVNAKDIRSSRIQNERIRRGRYPTYPF